MIALRELIQGLLIEQRARTLVKFGDAQTEVRINGHADVGNAPCFDKQLIPNSQMSMPESCTRSDFGHAWRSLVFQVCTRDVGWISKTAQLQVAQPLLFQCIVTNLHSAHDTLFKFCFSDAVRAAEEFRSILPPNLLRKIDWAALERIDGSFVDETLTQLHSDLLFSTKINGSPGLIYLLFEHQSHAEPLMPYRMLRYVDRALWSHVSANGNTLPLPAVIPILLHHSESGWTNATSMHQLFDESLVADEAIARLLPQMHLVVDDLSHLSDSELRLRAMGQVTKMMLWLLRDARNPTKFRVSLERWIGIFAEVSGAPCGMDALRVAYTYIAEVADVQPQELIELAKLHKVPQAEEQLMTMAQQWLKEGIEKASRRAVQKAGRKRCLTN